MIGLLQRVSMASVEVNGEVIVSIDRGLLVFLGVERDDSEAVMLKLLNKTLAYRIFENELGRMNLSIKDVRGALLVVPQFTLAADTSKGLRPGFSNAASPSIAEPLFEAFINGARSYVDRVEAGRFAADMKVKLINDGPCTFQLQVN